ncbi:unnamed protein product, partial [Staurois parvus]
MLTPSCPVPFVQCQYFFISTDHCIGVTGMSVTPSQFPPVSECPPQSH